MNWQLPRSKKTTETIFQGGSQRYARLQDCSTVDVPISVERVIAFCRVLLTSKTPAWQRLQAVRAIECYRNLVQKTSEPDLSSIRKKLTECRIALDESSKIAKRVSINLTDRRKQGNAGSEKKQCANAELKWRNRWLDAFVQLSSFLRQHNGCDHRAGTENHASRKMGAAKYPFGKDGSHVTPPNRNRIGTLALGHRISIRQTLT